MCVGISNESAIVVCGTELIGSCNGCFFCVGENSLEVAMIICVCVDISKVAMVVCV